MISAKILGVGSYVPPRIWKNDDLASLLDTSDEWIRQRTGIEQRHWVEGNVTTSDLAASATERACASAKIRVDEIDCIVFATLSPDHEFPGSGCFLQAKLGLSGVPAFDVRQQCSGFLYGLSLADQYVKSGMFRRVLVVGAEVHSKGLNKTPAGRDVTVLFGDGAGAVIVGPCEGSVTEKDSQIYSTHLHADGQFAKELWIAAPGMANGNERMNAAMVEEGLHYPKMNGKAVFMHASKRMPEAILEALEKNGKKVEDVDLFLFHQANLRINEMVGKQLGIPSEKIFNTIQSFANTTAATIPIGMDEAVKAGKLKKGMLVASAAFGSGFTWASTLFRW
ncbi:MAG: ketoacyl-ACP synthase III [Cryobacterium sp.]|nr:ketoacyl-ACP synthase III [Oligoflexia bacterium]